MEEEAEPVPRTRRPFRPRGAEEVAAAEEEARTPRTPGEVAGAEAAVEGAAVRTPQTRSGEEEAEEEAEVHTSRLPLHPWSAPATAPRARPAKAPHRNEPACPSWPSSRAVTPTGPRRCAGYLPFPFASALTCGLLSCLISSCVTGSNVRAMVPAMLLTMGALAAGPTMAMAMVKPRFG